MRAIIFEDNWAIFEQQQHTWDLSATFCEFHMSSISLHLFFCLNLHQVI